MVTANRLGIENNTKKQHQNHINNSCRTFTEKVFVGIYFEKILKSEPEIESSPMILKIQYIHNPASIILYSPSLSAQLYRFNGLCCWILVFICRDYNSHRNWHTDTLTSFTKKILWIFLFLLVFLRSENVNAQVISLLLLFLLFLFLDINIFFLFYLLLCLLMILLDMSCPQVGVFSYFFFVTGSATSSDIQ